MAEKRIAFVTIAVIVAFEAFFWLVVERHGREPLLVYDYQVYEQLAINLLSHHGFSPASAPPYFLSHWRPPGFPVFIAAIYAMFGKSALAVRIAHFVLLAALSSLMFTLARRFFSFEVAMIAAVLCATYPPLCVLATMYTTELLVTFIFMVAAHQIVTLEQTEADSLKPGLLAGFTLGVATLVRPNLIFYIGFVLVGLVLHRRAKSSRIPYRATIAMFVMYIAVVAPWIVRNSIITGRLTGPGGGGGWSLFVSAQQWKGELSFGLYRDEWDIVLAEFNRRAVRAHEEVLANPPANPRVSPLSVEEALVDQSFSRDAMVKFRNTPPAMFMKRLLPRLYWLWSTADVSALGATTLHRIFQLWHVVLLGFTAVGLWFCRRDLATLPVFLTMAVYLTFMHLGFQVEARYTVPGRPLLMVFAAVAFSRLWHVVAARR